MKHIKHLKLLFAALIVMIGVFSVGSNTFASLPGCDINSIEPENVSVQADNGDIEIQNCTGIGRSTWNNGVLGSARLSPQVFM